MIETSLLLIIQHLCFDKEDIRYENMYFSMKNHGPDLHYQPNIQFCVVRKPVGRCRLPPSGATTGPQREATAASLSHPSRVSRGSRDIQCYNPAAIHHVEVRAKHASTQLLLSHQTIPNNPHIDYLKEKRKKLEVKMFQKA